MLAAIDNRIVNFLTMIAWWSEVRFDITNRDIGFKCKMFSLILCLGFFSGLMVNMVLMPDKTWITIVAMIVCSLFLAMYMLSVVMYLVNPSMIRTIVDSHFKKGCPNPERILGLRTRSVNLLILCLCFLTLFIFMFSKMVVLYFFLISFNAASEYFYACDSIPPEEKARRKAANESFNAMPSMT